MKALIELDRLLSQSGDLEFELFGLFEDVPFSNDNKSMAVVAMSNIALEHAKSLRKLISIGLPTSALGLLRLQYEALVRAIWVLYAASDSDIAKLVAPLTPENEQKANNSLPSFSNMLTEIEKKAPPGVHRHLSEFKDYSWRPLNSFVHGGIHAVNRSRMGYPIGLLNQLIRQSNNLVHMSGIALAALINDSELTLYIVSMHKKYADCLQLL